MNSSGAYHSPDFEARARAQQPPPGFNPVTINVGFLGHNGPIMARREDDGGVAFGCRVMPEMCNPMGVTHGGWVATLFDLALPLTARLTIDEFASRFLMTVNLSIDYLSGPRLGAWMEVRARILRQTKRLVFIDGIMTSDGEMSGRANGIFRIGPDGPPLAL